MSWDYELTLIRPGEITQDDIGNQIPGDPVETVILCKLQSVGRTEFYNAAVAGLRPEMMFVIHGYEYNYEQSVRFDGVLYRVIRTYSTGFEELELTCERVAADG